MNKYLKAVTILMVLLLCLSFTVGAVQSDKMIKTKGELVQDKIKAKDFVKHQQSHDQNQFDRDVGGTLDVKVMSAKHKVPDGFEVPDEGYQTMVSYKANGKIFIRDTIHKVETVQIPWNEITSLPGFNGKSVLIKHYNDYGMQDAVWEQYVYNAGGYAYLEELPFSEIIVSGFVGTYTKSDVNVTPSDVPALGYTFDSDCVNYINLTVTDQYPTKTDPYDINTTGLVGEWKFDEGSGTNVSDSSGNGNHGTFSAETWVTTGKYNSGGNLSISTVTLPDLTEININNSFTISFYANFSDSSSGEVFIFSNNSSDRTGMSISNGALSAGLYDGVSYFVSKSTNVNPNKLYHISMTYDTSTLSLYINSNEQDGELTPGLGFDKYRIGTSAETLNATLDNFIIYNRSLSQDEIEQLYYIKTFQLQTRTNSNATYSEFWNSSSDNPLSVPYGAGESISSLRFDNTSSIVQNGIAIYEPVNMLFNTSIEIGHLENTTNVYEEVNDDSYQIFIQHIPGVNSTSGTISFTSDPNAILSSPYLTTGMDTSNTNAVMSYNVATRELNITTGAITAGTTYNYVLWGILEGEALADITTGGFGSDNMHAYTATANDTIIIGSAFRATYGDTAWGNQSNDLWSDLGPLFILAALVLVVGVVVVSLRRFRE